MDYIWNVEKCPRLAIIPQNHCLQATFGSGAAIFGLMIL